MQRGQPDCPLQLHQGVCQHPVWGAHLHLHLWFRLLLPGGVHWWTVQLNLWAGPGLWAFVYPSMCRSVLPEICLNIILLFCCCCHLAHSDCEPHIGISRTQKWNKTLVARFWTPDISRCGFQDIPGAKGFLLENNRFLIAPVFCLWCAKRLKL